MSDDVLAVLNGQNSKHDDTPTVASTEPVLTVWPPIRYCECSTLITETYRAE